MFKKNIEENLKKIGEKFIYFKSFQNKYYSGEKQSSLDVSGLSETIPRPTSLSLELTSINAYELSPKEEEKRQIASFIGKILPLLMI